MGNRESGIAKAKADASRTTGSPLQTIPDSQFPIPGVIK